MATLRGWPRQLPVLTPEQERVRDDFMLHWHKVLPNKYSMIEKFNHGAGIRKPIPERIRTLEVGAGIGAHIEFEPLDVQEYHAIELRPEMARVIKERFPAVHAGTGDIQKGLPYSDQFFDRIIAIHVLEHLPNLPVALREIRRLLKPGGVCDFVLPCEGSLAYSVARKISAERIFKKRYGMSYDWFIQSEHVSSIEEIIHELGAQGFTVRWRRFFPFPLPFYFMNLVVGVQCTVEPQSPR